MAVVFLIPKAWFFNKKSKSSEQGWLLGLSCFETGSMTGILEKLKRESLSKKRRRDSRLILLCKGLKNVISIPTDALIPSNMRSRNHHSLTFRPPLQELTFTRVHSSLKQSEIGMPFPIRLLHLLKEQRMLWLDLPLW